MLAVTDEDMHNGCSFARIETKKVQSMSLISEERIPVSYNAGSTIFGGRNEDEDSIYRSAF